MIWLFIMLIALGYCVCGGGGGGPDNTCKRNDITGKLKGCKTAAIDGSAKIRSIRRQWVSMRFSCTWFGQRFALLFCLDSLNLVDHEPAYIPLAPSPPTRRVSIPGPWTIGLNSLRWPFGIQSAFCRENWLISQERQLSFQNRSWLKAKTFVAVCRKVTRVYGMHKNRNGIFRKKKEKEFQQQKFRSVDWNALCVETFQMDQNLCIWHLTRKQHSSTKNS